MVLYLTLLTLLPLTALQSLHQVVHFYNFRKRDDMIFVHGHHSIDLFWGAKISTFVLIQRKSET